MPFLPREHGAYGQLAFPLVTSFAVAGVTTASLLISVAAVAAFLAHEPLLVLLGRRGARAKREEQRRAAAWFAMTGAAAAATGFVGAWSLAPDTRWSLTLPVLPAGVAGVAIIAAREKSAAAEVAVASAFSLLAVPICLAANASLSTALAVGTAFALVFVVGTLAARAIVLDVRGGGDPRAARSTRIAVVVLTGAGSAALAATAAASVLPWTTLVAAAPGLIAGSWLAVRPPAPARLRLVGWTLVAVSAAAALMLIASLA
jgi:hypothetical protein